ncbi:putative coiled coil protein [Cryptosporidium canis]|uniref:Coiled coil protein n=1 Tax=Cryptosporidium canis TaxID=195482 RepID=A0ABQ8P6A6_9CRYT|nr:putative coiled coil protein [Cryptosporidium canis]
MDSLDEGFGRRRRGKRLLKPVDSDDSEDQKGHSAGRGRSSTLEMESGSDKMLASGEELGHKSRTDRRVGGGTGVLAALIHSIRNEGGHASDNSETQVIMEDETLPEVTKPKRMAKKRKKKDAGSVDVSSLLNSLDNKASRLGSKKSASKADVDSMFESFSIPSSDTENNSDSQMDHSEIGGLGQNGSEELFTNDPSQDIINEEELLNLTELEMALRESVRDDYNSSLKLNEWLPSHCIHVRSDIAHQMNDDVKADEITERHEFFYSQWIEQIGFLSSLTKGFKRKIHDCFVLKDQILAISSIKESNPDLLLDPEDQILVTVQNSDSCVILSRLVNIANSQEKLIIEMNKEAEKAGIGEDDPSFRLKFGVISKKARTKLWWYCRMAEHCGLVGRELGNTIKYYVIEQGRGKGKASNLVFSENANVISSTDPTMQIFNTEDPEVNREDETESVGDGYEENDGGTSRTSELDSKWSEISSIKVSSKARPWEKRSKQAEQKPLETKPPATEENTASRSKKELFKFMLKNIGPRPIWSNTRILESTDSEEARIEIEPPRNLSTREQGQLKIKWLQMRSQAEKLATHHFKVMDPETKDLDQDALKRWCKLFKVNLLFPSCDASMIRKKDKSDMICPGTPTAKDQEMEEEIPEPEVIMEDEGASSVAALNPASRNSLPLEVEYVSDLSGSDAEIPQEDGKSDEQDLDDSRIINTSESEDDESADNLDENQEDYQSAEETMEHELDTVQDSNGEAVVQENESEDDEEDAVILEKRREAYRKLKAIRRNRKRFKKRMMEKYGHLFENEAEESDEDGANIFSKIDQDDSEDDDELDWDELSGFSDFIDDNNYEDGELEGDAIQAHLRHMKQIEERQYRQLFTLEGIKERKNKVYGFAADQDDGIEGETRLEKKKNEMLFNSAFFDDDVISEFWTDDEEQDDYEEEIDERNLTEMLGLDYEEWQSSLPKKTSSSDESLNQQRKLNYDILKDSLIKEASGSINITKQKLQSIQVKLNDENTSLEEKKELEIKYLECMEKLKKLLSSIHSACNKCIYENSHYFDHIDIYLYIQKRQESRQQKKTKAKDSKKLRQKSNLIRENLNTLNRGSGSISDSEDEIICQKETKKGRKNIVNVKGGRFIMSR